MSSVDRKVLERCYRALVSVGKIKEGLKKLLAWKLLKIKFAQVTNPTLEAPVAKNCWIEFHNRVVNLSLDGSMEEIKALEVEASEGREKEILVIRELYRAFPPLATMTIEQIASALSLALPSPAIVAAVSKPIDQSVPLPGTLPGTLPGSPVAIKSPKKTRGKRKKRNCIVPTTTVPTAATPSSTLSPPTVTATEMAGGGGGGGVIESQESESKGRGRPRKTDSVVEDNKSKVVAQRIACLEEAKKYVHDTLIEREAHCREFVLDRQSPLKAQLIVGVDAIKHKHQSLLLSSLTPSPSLGGEKGGGGATKVGTGMRVCLDTILDSERERSISEVTTKVLLEQGLCLDGVMDNRCATFLVELEKLLAGRILDKLEQKINQLTPHPSPPSSSLSSRGRGGVQTQGGASAGREVDEELCHQLALSDFHERTKGRQQWLKRGLISQGYQGLF